MKLHELHDNEGATRKKKSELDVALVPAKVKPVAEVSKVKNLGQV